MEMVMKGFLMEIIILDNMLMLSPKVLEIIFGLMEVFIKEILKMD